jgi:hypothetical protein
VNEQTTATKDPDRLLRKKDREFLVELFGQHAGFSRPPYNRVVDWLDTITVTALLDDGGQAVFALSQVSHLTTHRENPKADATAPAPADLPAVIHFKNGDFIVTKESFGLWSQKLEVAHHRAYKSLGELLGK